MALFRILAIILAMVSLLILPSLATAFILGEFTMIKAFLIPLAIGGFLALIAVLIPKKSTNKRDGGSFSFRARW